MGMELVIEDRYIFYLVGSTLMPLLPYIHCNKCYYVKTMPTL